MKKDDAVYLRHIADAIARIEEYLRGVSAAQFLARTLLQDGVVRQLEVIGEAGRNLSDEFRQQHPEVPWNQIIALRNRVIHAYFEIDLDIVWEIAQDDIPVLKAHVERFLREMAGQQ